METNPKIGILAYGSLIAHPGSEIEAVRIDTIEDVMTPFAIEYARSSGGRGGAPTLVPFETGGKVRAQVFVVDVSVEDAANRLYRREINAVGEGKVYRHTDRPGRNTVVVDMFDNVFGLDVVLSTRIAATILQPTAEELARLAIDSVAKTGEGRDGITYLMDAINAGIETPLTEDYQAEILQRVAANDLAEALAIVRAEAGT